jgi:hypothetical protein
MSPILSRAVAIALAMNLTQILWAVTLGAVA